MKASFQIVSVGFIALAISTVASRCVGCRSHRRHVAAGVLDRGGDRKQGCPKVFGEHPNGLLTLTADNRVMQIVTDPNRKLPAQTKITDAEALQLFQTMNAFAGSYKTEGDKLIWRREIDARGSFVGAEQVRFFKVDGDRLQYHSVPFVSSFDGKEIVSNSGLGSGEISSGFYVNLGVAGLLFDTSASINAAGSPLPGSNLHASNNATLGFGIGYFVTPDVSLLALLGVPPQTTLTGRGTLSGLTLGKVTYGPSMLTANYHFRQFGAFQPFLGAGITYTVVFGTKDSAIVNLRVRNSIGAVIRGGFDVMFSDRWGAFFSVSKVFVTTKASGNANPAIPL